MCSVVQKPAQRTDLSNEASISSIAKLFQPCFWPKGQEKKTVIVTMTITSEMKKQLQELIGKSLPNGVIINHVIGWLDAADDKLARDDLIRLMKRTYTVEEISEGKELLKDAIKQNHQVFSPDKSIDKLITGKREPEKKEKEAADVVDLMCKLNDQGKIPNIPILSTDLVRNPLLQNMDDNVENVSHKVKMLETCIVNLVDNKIPHTNGRQTNTKTTDQDTTGS